MASRLVQALPVPVTAKIRLGWDEQSKNYVEVAHVLEDSGVSAIAVHGRTKAQGYTGRANWEAIAEVKDAVKVPVLGNGDVRTIDDIEAIKTMTGCDGVLIGRAAIGNPWIFARRSISEVGWDERLAMIRRHLLAMVDYYDEHVGLILFRKHVVKYVQGVAGAAALRPRLVSSETPEALLGVLEGWSLAHI
jgi:nifR3 family TIM-barrel protein